MADDIWAGEGMVKKELSCAMVWRKVGGGVVVVDRRWWSTRGRKFADSNVNQTTSSLRCERTRELF